MKQAMCCHPNEFLGRDKRIYFFLLYDFFFCEKDAAVDRTYSVFFLKNSSLSNFLYKLNNHNKFFGFWIFGYSIKF